MKYLAKLFWKEIRNRDRKYWIITSYMFLWKLYFWKYETL